MWFITKIKTLPVYIKNNERTILLILTLFVILMRTVFVYISYKNNGTENWDDDWYYLSMGEQIADGNWEPKTDDRPQMIVGPVIPLLIALFIKLFNGPTIPMFIYNIIVTSLVVVILYYLGKEVFNRKVGWFIALWGVFFIEFFKYCPHLLKEPSIFFLVPLTLLLLIKSVKANFNLKYITFSALSYSILIHIDERFFIYFPIFALTFFLVKPLTLVNVSKPFLTFVFLVILLMLPWGFRNYNVFRQVVILTPRTTAITSKFWGTNLETASSHFTNENIRKILNEGRYEKAVEFGKLYGITPHEQGKYEARLKAFINFWQPTYFIPTYIQYGFRPHKWSVAHNGASLLFYGIYLPFYLAGIWILLKRRYTIGLFLASIPFIHSLLHAYLVWPLERYRSPITFIIVLIGIWTVFEIYEIIKIKFHSQSKIISI